MKSPRTTIAAIGIILASLGTIIQALFDGDPTTTVQWSVHIPVLIAAVGFFFSRDQAEHDAGN